MPEQFGEFIARLTDNARTSLQHAESIARGQGSPYIGTEHMLLGVLAQGSSVGAKMLADAGVTLQRAETALNLSPRSMIVSTKATALSETAMLTLKMAFEHARELHQEYLGTEHILYSILRQKGARGTVLLRDMSTDIEQIIDELESYFDRQQDDYDEMATTEQAQAHGKQPNGALEQYGTDLTDRAARGELDVVIGREHEEERLVTILSRRTKNNPVLIGEPGVGKTAIVEGLAQRIVKERVPEHLLDKKIIQLDLAGMVAGTKYRGEFEERLQQVVREIKKRENVIVFIDELHLLVGAGAAEGAMDAANILKPALARGEMHLIGATTIDEYRKNIEKDAALERRFQEIIVREPSLDDTKAIIRGLKPYYEQHHNVVFSDEVLDSAVHMANRYISERFMPDKAIDVIDEAAALSRVTSAKTPQKSRVLRQEIKQLNEKIDDAVTNEDYERAALYKTHLSRLTAQLEEADKSATPSPITEQQIARAISMMTGIPVEKVQTSERNRLKHLEKHLSRAIIGQDEAVRQVARAIRRSRSGISSHARPIGSFVFMGSTGVGKTQLARVLAEEVFGSKDALIKIDMSEFAERHTTSRLVGAPAGYVGYEDGGKLTDRVRRQPYSVVLFDEIEKAHPDVMTMLLQILEDGTLTDAHGRSVSFKNTIIILTSNLGSEAMAKESKLGFGLKLASSTVDLDEAHKENERVALTALRRFLKPELINRFDGIVVFRSLTRRDVGKIFDLLIGELRGRLHLQGYGLTVSPVAKRWLIDKGFDAKNGARPLRRAIEEHVEHAIAEVLLGQDLEKGDIINVDITNGGIELAIRHENELVTA